MRNRLMAHGQPSLSNLTATFAFAFLLAVKEAKEMNVDAFRARDVLQ
jgi:hypothetical protein